MKRSKQKAEKKSGTALALIISGLALIIILSLLDGFVYSFVNTVHHIVSDLTVDLKVHAYIAGFVLLIYGLYKMSRSWQRK